MTSKKVASKRPNSQKTKKVIEPKTGLRITQETDQEFWLVYQKDEGSPEDCSVFYSDLVLARSEFGAIDAIAKGNREKRGCLGAHQVKLIIAQDKDVVYDPIDFTSLSDEEDDEDS